MDTMIQTFEIPLIVENPAELLRDEEGVFEVTSPYGHVFTVTCVRGSKLNVHEIAKSVLCVPASGSGWQIKRIVNPSVV
jgi:hypothetical protein